MSLYNAPTRGWANPDGNCGEQFFASSSSGKPYYFGCKTSDDSLCGKVHCTGGDNIVRQTEMK